MLTSADCVHMFIVDNRMRHGVQVILVGSFHVQSELPLFPSCPQVKIKTNPRSQNSTSTSIMSQ